MYNENDDDDIDADIKNNTSKVWLSSTDSVSEKTTELYKRIKILADLLVKLDAENKELKEKLLKKYEYHR